MFKDCTQPVVPSLLPGLLMSCCGAGSFIMRDLGYIGIRLHVKHIALYQNVLQQ